MQAACKIVAPKLGVSWHTARQWTQAARREGRVVESMPEDLARSLDAAGVESVSTGSTAANIADLGINVTPVEKLTGFPDEHSGSVGLCGSD